MDNRAEFVRIKEKFGENAVQNGSSDHDDKLLFAEFSAG